MSLFSKKETGDAGEDYCVKYLKKHGYRILSRNYRKPYGEIDVVAAKKGVTCFVEVKTRREDPLTQPYESVTYRKQQRLIKAAQSYCVENDIQSVCRFDICEVIVRQDTLKLVSLNYIENAFEA